MEALLGKLIAILAVFILAIFTVLFVGFYRIEVTIHDFIEELKRRH